MPCDAIPCLVERSQVLSLTASVFGSVFVLKDVCVKVRVFCANSELCGTSMCHESTLYNVWGICMLWAGFVCFGVGLSGGQSLGTVSRNCKGCLDDGVMNGRDACFEHVSSL